MSSSSWVHVLSSSYSASNFEVWNGRKAKQRWDFRVANDIVLNQFLLNHERLCEDNVVSKFWFVRSSSSQPYSKFIPNTSTEKVSQVRIKKGKTRTFVFKVNLPFLRSSRHFNCDTAFAVIETFLNESAHGFNNIRIGRVDAGFQIVKFKRIWKTPTKKTWTIPLCHFAQMMGKIFPKLQPPVDLPDSVAPVKSFEWAECIVWKKLKGCIKN